MRKTSEPELRYTFRIDAPTKDNIKRLREESYDISALIRQLLNRFARERLLDAK